MTVRDICDVAWTVLTDRLERRVLADRSALLGQVKAEDVPDFGVAVAAFADALAAEPADINPRMALVDQIRGT